VTSREHRSLFQSAREKLEDLAQRASGGAVVTRSLVTARPLTMNDRLRVAAQASNLLDLDSAKFSATADELIDAVRCCGYFPECSHVLAYTEENRG
jgi:hypothetical protein